MSAAEVPVQEKKGENNNLPHLSALEEDDEFEEFEVEGISFIMHSPRIIADQLAHCLFKLIPIDWEEKDQERDDSHFWDDNWDDDDVDDAFFKQLR